MAERNQESPLAPSRDQPSIDEELAQKKSTSKRKFKLFGFVTISFLLLLVIVILIIAFTVFKVKDPKITTNSVTLTNLDLRINSIPSVNLNMSLLIDMSIKNPNSASFRFGNTTTCLYYGDEEVADARIPSGLAKAHRTMRLNVTADIMADRLISSPTLVTEVTAGHVSMSSYTTIAGRVKVLFIKKHVEVRMNCNMTITISSRAIQDMNCQRKVKV